MSKKIVKTDLELLQVLATLGTLFVKALPADNKMEIIKQVTEIYSQAGIEVDPKEVIEFVESASAEGIVQ